MGMVMVMVMVMRMRLVMAMYKVRQGQDEVRYIPPTWWVYILVLLYELGEEVQLLPSTVSVS